MLQLELEAWARAWAWACSLAAWAVFVVLRKQPQSGPALSAQAGSSALGARLWEGCKRRGDFSSLTSFSFRSVSFQSCVVSALGFLQSPSGEQVKCHRAGAPAAGWAVCAGLARG